MNGWWGWLRESKVHPWRRIAEAPDWAQCTDQTIGYPAEGRTLEVIVLPAGQMPIGRYIRPGLQAVPVKG